MTQQNWLFLGAAAAVLILSPAPAAAASEEVCGKYAKELEKIVVLGTNDPDVGQLVYERAAAYCGVVDLPPLELTIDPEQGTAPATVKPKNLAGPPPVPSIKDLPKFPPEWMAVCKRRYHSFDPDDGTVLRHGSRNRVRCPVKL